MNAIALLGGAVLIAGAILFALRWEIVASGQGIYRLDRWSGEVTSCSASVDGLQKQARLQAAQMNCEPQ